MKLKGAWIFPLFFSVIFVVSAFGDKLVEIVPPITKVRFLPTATSGTTGMVRKGQRFTVDGESGPWYRIRVNNTPGWIPKEAVTVLETFEPPPQPASATTAQAQPGGTSQETTRTQHAVRPVQPQQQAGGVVPAGTTPPGTIPPGTAPGGTTPAVEAPPVARAPAYIPPPPPKVKKIIKPPKKEWYSQFSHISEAESGKEIFFFQIASNEAAVYSLSNTAAAVLLKTKKGDYFPLLEDAGAWCKIAMKDTIGWIESNKGEIVSAPSMGFFEEYQLIIIIAGAITLLFITAFIIILFRRRTRTRARKAEPFHALVIAKSPPQIQTVISNKAMPLEKYLGAIGFSVKTVHEVPSAKKIIVKLQPDTVFIDWNSTDDIPSAIEQLFAGYDEKKLPLTIFLNVPDVSDIPLIPLLPRAYHLGRSCSDHDISKLVTPIMLSRTSQKTAASALEGDIAEGNLPEIMQFIETGKKTGCLLIEAESPLGMLYFDQGRIIHAAAANNVMGRDAINFLLGQKQGKFRFLLNKQPKTSDLNLSTLEVLMEWSKTEDEAHRH